MDIAINKDLQALRVTGTFTQGNNINMSIVFFHDITVSRMSTWNSKFLDLS